MRAGGLGHVSADDFIHCEEKKDSVIQDVLGKPLQLDSYEGELTSDTHIGGRMTDEDLFSMIRYLYLCFDYGDCEGVDLKACNVF